MSTSTASTGGSSTSVVTQVPVTSAIEHDEIIYGSNSDESKPDEKCCCKTYHIVLNFH